MPFDSLAWLRLKYGPGDRYYQLGFPGDPILKKGQWRVFYPRFQELDPLYLDPPIKDSQVSVRVGEDSCTVPRGDIVYRYLGMPVKEWKFKVLYLQNPTIKHIYDNWDISKEHPGMLFRNGLRSQWETLENQGNLSIFHTLLKRYFGMGRYFDAAEGDECFVKAWACARFMFMWTSVAWVMDCTNAGCEWGVAPFLKHLVRLSYMPVTAGWIWGAFTCLTCSARGTDDLINYWWGSVAAGTCWGLRFGLHRGCQVGAFCTISTFFWRLMIDSQEGTFGQMNRVDMNAWGDPTSWKWWKIETSVCDPKPLNF